MAERTIQLVLHYDGAGFCGWQRQPAQRTVQSVVEDALKRLVGQGVHALASGRTDTGVHARGQSVGVKVSTRWTAAALRRALNAVLPDDVWVADAVEMHPEFHARYSAVSRCYTYYVGTEPEANSPFRRRYEWGFTHPLDRTTLDMAAAGLLGERCFRGFAVRGTAPPGDSHRCHIQAAAWRDRPGGIVFEIKANRFLHHMVRFLVGTMLDVGSGRRPLSDISALLAADANDEVSRPAPPHGLFLDRVEYPPTLYISG